VQGKPCKFNQEVSSLYINHWRIFLISTDGSLHGHPDLETIARLIARPAKVKRQLIFNYANNTFEFFDRQDWMDKYNYSIVLNSTGTAIEL